MRGAEKRFRDSKTGEDLLRYNRVARFYDLIERPMELFMFKNWRRYLFEKMGSENFEGKLILEIGIGTGKNIPYYKKGRFVAIDISEKMIRKAKKRAERLGLKIDLIIADAESLPFKDGVFDKIFTTFVFCSVDNPVLGLKEAYRILKNEEKAYYLEHMLPESKLLQPFFHFLNPVARLMGPEINRKTDLNIKKAGFKITEQEYLLGSVFRLIVAEKRD